ncbi:Ribulose-phosphate 3-epimerase [Spiroplasma clarkii]|uniref:Ribulose-phosphate 3-epimerase n=1 Tax=Spiroplasma clarkii TaxID=2139 RepID=A0A1Y0L032_9MOLU|nr:ribulose-phosphate 3-epimerase [Spiroplasma clarkii]ARU91374.1 Ribulose-phosphate 3-epimerase [Spiroplasma clarkii]ATX70791.1 ribulose-phosphate 3-epimerase [Spiroplasma clarkii]
MTKLNISLHIFDLTNLTKTIEAALAAKINYFHIDIMDGKFVKNFALCQRHIFDIKQKYDNVIIDAHLMIEEPQNYVTEFAKSGKDIFNFHYKAVQDGVKLKQLLAEIKNNGMQAALMLDLDTDIDVIKPFVTELDIVALMSIKTGFPGQNMNKDVINRIKAACELKKLNPNLLVEVDGGVREDTYKEMILAGADILVVGHFLLNQDFQTQFDKIKVVK